MGNAMGRTRRHVLGIRSMEGDELERLLDRAAAFFDGLDRDVPSPQLLSRHVVTTLFYEPSTRTRVSFERAAHELGAEVITLTPAASSVVKGERLKDTIRTLEAAGSHVIVMRHPSGGAAHFAAQAARSAAIVNAGDGAHEHPTQALIDATTIRRLRGPIAGKHVVIVGDILHSRVARSNMLALQQLGARVTMVGPPTFLLPEGAFPDVGRSTDLDEVLPDADVVYMLRIQHERQRPGRIPGLREYRHLFGLTQARAARLKEDALIMHPGPANIGVEIDDDVLDDPRVAIIDQVRTGVAVRMAVLAHAAGGEGDAPHH